MLVELVRITDIKIGERYRQDLGDVQALADSIKEVGLLHPPVIDSGNVLIAGERRIRACELLGWTEIPVRRLDLADIVRGEYAENAIRAGPWSVPPPTLTRTRKVDPVHRKLRGKAKKAPRGRIRSITLELTLAEAAEVVKALSKDRTEQRQEIIKKVRSALLRTKR